MAQTQTTRYHLADGNSRSAGFSTLADAQAAFAQAVADFPDAYPSNLLVEVVSVTTVTTTTVTEAVVDVLGVETAALAA